MPLLPFEWAARHSTGLTCLPSISAGGVHRIPTGMHGRRTPRMARPIDNKNGRVSLQPLCRGRFVDPIPLARNPVSESTIRLTDWRTKFRKDQSLDRSNPEASFIHERCLPKLTRCPNPSARTFRVRGRTR